MRQSFSRISWALVGALAFGSVAACGHDSDADSGTDVATHDAANSDASGDAAQTLYDKYGGAPTVTALVDQAVTGLLGDCTEAPYFAVVGTAGHDSVDRLKACLRLQFTAALGGPATYPGMAMSTDGTMTYTCEDMTTIHTGLGIPGDVFDKFIVDLGAVLMANGVESADITTIAGALTGLRSQIVAATPTVYNACDGGASGDGG